MRLPDYDFGDMAKLKRLTADEEKDLARRRDAGDDRAAETLVRHNVRLVLSVASGFAKQTGQCELHDLVSEGYFGLAEAARRFSADAGTRFSTYACVWIKQAILLYLNGDAQAIRIPINVRADLYRVDKRAKILADAGKDATPDAAMQSLGFTPKWTEYVQAATLTRSVSQYPVQHDGRDVDFDGKPIDTDAIIDRIDRESLMVRVRDSLGVLDEREREVIRARYLGDESESLTSVGRRFDLCRERIRQIEDRALAKLREALVA